MKKNHYLYLWLTMMAILICYSCLKESNEPDRTSGQTFSVEEAMAFFEDYANTMQLRCIVESKLTRSSQKTPDILPRWKSSRCFEFEDHLVIEIPFNLPPGKRKFAKQGRTVDDSVAGNSNTITRLLAEKLDEGLIDYKIVEITATDFYLKRIDNKVKKISLSNLNEFSGTVRYSDLSGKFLFGKIYKEGKIIGYINPSDSETKTTQSNSLDTRYWGYEEHCDTHVILVEQCYYSGYMQDGEVEITNVECYSWIEYETWCYTTTEWYDNYYGGDPDDPNNPNPDDPNNPNNPTDPSTPVIPDRYIFENLTDEQKAQVIALLNQFENYNVLRLIGYTDPVIIRIDPNLKVEGAYDPNTNTITFRDPANTQLDPTVREEIFHAFQDKFYPDGIAQYLGSHGSASVEFEAKVFCDLARAFEAGYLPYTMTVDNNDETAYNNYTQWLSDITHGFDSSQQMDGHLVYGEYDEMLGYFLQNCENSKYDTSTTDDVHLDALMEAFYVN